MLCGLERRNRYGLASKTESVSIGSRIASRIFLWRYTACNNPDTVGKIDRETYQAVPHAGNDEPAEETEPYGWQLSIHGCLTRHHGGSKLKVALRRGTSRTNLLFRARWFANADAASRQPSGIKPSLLARVFFGRIYTDLPRPANRRSG
jgi:hypothetical protein